jgi:predicted carbohydrate-binding protein with CBM5 and CBM33 domain
LNFTLASGENFSLPLKLKFPGTNSATKFKIKINGCYSEIKYKDSIDSNYKTFSGGNGIIGITRINNESLGNEISENGTWYDGNYYAGFDGNFLTIEDGLVDLPDNITQRSYTTTDITSGYNTFVLEFNSTVELTELLVSPAINDNQFLPLPTMLTLWKSLDNGLTWLKIDDYTIGENNIPEEWYPYVVTNKLEALRQTGGFFRLIL